jgi:hypothetical protein
MVLDLLALTTLPLTIATVEGVRHQNEKDKEADVDYRMRDFHIKVFCSAKSRKREQVDDSVVVLKDGKVSELFPTERTCRQSYETKRSGRGQYES